MHMSAQKLNVIAGAMAHLCVARRGLYAQAFQVYGHWVEQAALDMRKNDESITWADWLSKFEESHWPPDSGTTLTYQWALDPHSGEIALRSLGFQSYSLNLTTYFWTSLDSVTLSTGHFEGLED